jgi:hypothetical protein
MISSNCCAAGETRAAAIWQLLSPARAHDATLCPLIQGAGVRDLHGRLAIFPQRKLIRPQFMLGPSSLGFSRVGGCSDE